MFWSIRFSKKISLSLLLFVFGSVLFFGCEKGSQATNSSNKDAYKVAYHISEAGRAPVVLRNIRNHINGVEDKKALDIIVVAHATGVKPFLKDTMAPGIDTNMQALRDDGVKFNVCGNTLKGLKVGLNDLYDGFTSRPEGGVVRLAELQSKGYVYLRP